ncbi:MAG: GntR family transcriptional regulator, partial [Halomonas sp.]
MATLTSHSSTAAAALSETAGEQGAPFAIAASTATLPEVRTLAERVFHQLQDAIVRGELAPGSKITEPGLSKTYGISRGPLREAMRRLEA